MDFQKDIERLYAESLREDLEWISAHAMPSHHWYPTSPFPQGAPAYSGSSGSSGPGSTRVFATDLALKVTQVHLEPFDLARVGGDRDSAGGDEEDESEFMEHFRLWRALPPGNRRNQEERFATRAYMHEGLVLELHTKIWHVPDGTNQAVPLVVTLAHVDYVNTDEVDDFARLVDEGRVHVHGAGYAARWPEQLLIRYPDGSEHTFHRSDLV